MHNAFMSVTISTAASPGPDWWAALNALHPIVVHFPIALVITAALVEFIAMLARTERPTQFTLISLLVGAVACVIASWSGWGLADEGYGGGWELDLHRWLGIATSGLVVLLAIVAVIAFRTAKRWATGTVRAGILFAAVMVGATGHFGGDMVWGGSLLMEALFPEPVVSAEPQTIPVPNTVPATTGVDAEEPAVGTSRKVLSFQTDIVPILDKHCWKCHGPADRGQRAKAGIRLATRSELFGDQDGVFMVVPNDLEESLLYHVVALPRDDSDAMPPSGPGLDEAELDALRTWIMSGAPFDDGAGTEQAPSTQETPAPTTAPEPAADTTGGADAAILAALAARGVPARAISQAGPDLEFNANALSHRITPPFSDADLDLLKGLESLLVEIDLSNTAVTDAGIARLAGFDALRSIKLKDTRIGDPSASVLAGLPSLEVVNVFGTDIGDAGLLELAGSSSIRTIYAGESAVTTGGVAAATKTDPDLVIHHQGPSTTLPSENESVPLDPDQDAAGTG